MQEDLRDANVGDCCAAAKEDGPDVVDNYGLNAPVRVKHGEGAENSVGDGSRVEEGKDHRRHLRVFQSDSSTKGNVFKWFSRS